MGLNGSEIFLIIMIILVVIGIGKLPQIGEAIGRARRNFKKASDPDAIDISPSTDKRKATSRAPDMKTIVGDEEDAELVDEDAEREEDDRHAD